VFGIIKNFIFFGSQNYKEFNPIQFLVELIILLGLVFISLININNHIAGASCSFLSKLIIFSFGGFLSIHLSYYQATHITWKYIYPKNRPPAIAQILIYTIFYLSFLVAICKFI